MDMSVCVLVVLAMVFSGANANFDCRRGTGNVLCLHGGLCTPTSSDCICDGSTTFGGPDCGYDTDTICDDVTCESGGTCHGRTTPHSCYCAPGFAGFNCEVNLYKLECEYANYGMKIKIMAGGPAFYGKIYAEGKPACLLKESHDNILSHANDVCGNAAPTGPAPNTVYERKIVVQYATDTVRPSDEIITFVCGSSKDVILTDNSVTIKDYVQGTINRINKGSAASTEDVSMSRTSTGDLDFGVPVEIKIEVTPKGLENGFKDVSIKSCQLQEQGDSPTVVVKLIDDFCPVAAASGIMHRYNDQYISRIGTDKRTFKFTAIYLASATSVFKQLALTCTVRVCNDAADCDITIETCSPGVQEANGRKKRQAGVKAESLKLNITITNPMSDKQSESTTSQHLDVKPCYQTWEMNVTLAVLGVGLVLVLVVCLVLAVKVILHRKSETAMGKC